MKKFVGIILISVMMLSMVACGDDSSSKSTHTSKGAKEMTTAEMAANQSAVEEAEGSNASATAVAEEKVDEKEAKKQAKKSSKDKDSDKDVTMDSVEEMEDSREETPVTSDTQSDLKSEEATVTVKYLSDSQYSKDDIESVSVADSSDAVTSLLFEVQGEVTNFKLLSLSMTDVADDGTPSFDIEELYVRDTLNSAHPLCVDMVFAGDLPTFGYSYIDPSGNEKRFSISQSGMDGSLVVTEF